MANRLTREQRRAGITLYVGAPPPCPPKPRQQRPVSIWPTAMLGTLVLIACIALWFGANHDPGGLPPGTTTVMVQTTPWLQQIGHSPDRRDNWVASALNREAASRSTPHGLSEPRAGAHVVTQIRVLAKGGYVLTYDSDDVEHVDVSTLHDTVETEGPNGTTIRELAGTSHLRLGIDFKPGKRALWIKDGQAS